MMQLFLRCLPMNFIYLVRLIVCAASMPFAVMMWVFDVISLSQVPQVFYRLIFSSPL